MDFKNIGHGYSVSQDGNVFSTKTWRGSCFRQLRPIINTAGYATVVINRGHGTRRYKIANLVCEAFHGPSPFHGAVVRHLDDNRRNDVAGNLAWGTRSDNAKDAVRNGRCAAAENGRKSAPNRAGNRHYLSKLTWAAVREIRARRAMGERGADLAREFGVMQATICDIVKGRTWNEDNCHE